MDVDGEDWVEDDGGGGGDGQAGVHTDGGYAQEIKVRRQPPVINIIYTNLTTFLRNTVLENHDVFTGIKICELCQKIICIFA